MADVDYAQRYGLRRDPRRRRPTAVGHGAYIDDGPGRAEVAFAVADELQGQGLGTILLAHLAEVAAGERGRGLRRRGDARRTTG